MSSQTVPAFTPVLLGTELSAYGLARAFDAEYGVASHAFGTFPLTPTRDSRMVTQHCDPDFNQAERMVEVLNAAAPQFEGAPALLIPCGDDYTVLLSHVKDQLDPVYIPVCSDAATIDRVSDKELFYNLCEERGVPYPATKVVSGPDAGDLPFEFPVALKPTDGRAFREHPFEGQKKAFVLNDRASLDAVLERTYAAGYPDRMVIQDFIPGDDSNMRVANGYMRADGSLALVAQGQPLLEDYSPMAIGNYAAILSGPDQQIYESIERLMSGLDYFGLFNIDMKYDPRDGVTKLFEINPRQGRSSYFVTLAGYNLARFIVEDLIEHKGGPCVYGTNEALWLGVPASIVRRYAADTPAKRRALEVLKSGVSGSTIWGAHDNAPKRLVNMSKLWLRYHAEYKRHFGHRELEQ